MSPPVNIAEAVLTYYATNRQIGHTTAVLFGAFAEDALIVAANEQQAHQLRSMIPPASHAKVIAMWRLAGLRGNRPLVLDYLAIQALLADLLEENRELKAKLKER